jgi:hypothetical protein
MSNIDDKKFQLILKKNADDTYSLASDANGKTYTVTKIIEHAEVPGTVMRFEIDLPDTKDSSQFLYYAPGSTKKNYVNMAKKTGLFALGVLAIFVTRESSRRGIAQTGPGTFVQMRAERPGSRTDSVIQAVVITSTSAAIRSLYKANKTTKGESVARKLLNLPIEGYYYEKDFSLAIRGKIPPSALKSSLEDFD